MLRGRRSHQMRLAQINCGIRVYLDTLTFWVYSLHSHVKFASQQTRICVTGGASARRLQSRCETANMDFVERVAALYVLMKAEKWHRYSSNWVKSDFLQLTRLSNLLTHFLLSKIIFIPVSIKVRRCIVQLRVSTYSDNDFVLHCDFGFLPPLATS